MRRTPLGIITSSLAVATLGTALLAAPAQAASPAVATSAPEVSALRVYETLGSSADPSTFYAALPDVERAVFDAYFLPARTEQTITLTPLDADAASAAGSGAVATEYASLEAAQDAAGSTLGCWGTAIKQTAYAAVGNALYDTFTEGTWCANGSSVTSATFGRSWSSIAAIGWRDGGQVGSGSGVVGNRGKVWSQRKLIFGIGGWDAQTQLPCTRLIGTSAGQASGDKSCSIY